MNKRTITPNPQQPVNRTSTGQLPTVLAELQEDNLIVDSHVLPGGPFVCVGCDCCLCGCGCCSFDGDDE